LPSREPASRQTKRALHKCNVGPGYSPDSSGVYPTIATILTISRFPQPDTTRGAGSTLGRRLPRGHSFCATRDRRTLPLSIPRTISPKRLGSGLSVRARMVAIILIPVVGFVANGLAFLIGERKVDMAF